MNQVQWFGIRLTNIGFPKEFFLPALRAGGLDTAENEVEIHRASRKRDYVDIWLPSNGKRRAVDKALRAFIAPGGRKLWVTELANQPANLPFRDNMRNKTFPGRITRKLTSLIEDWQAQRVQNNEAEKASDTMNQDHAILPGEGNVAEEKGQEAKKPQQLSYNRPLVPYSDSESGESVADSPRNEPANSAASSKAFRKRRLTARCNDIGRADASDRIPASQARRYRVHIGLRRILHGARRAGWSGARETHERSNTLAGCFARHRVSTHNGSVETLRPFPKTK